MSRDEPLFNVASVKRRTMALGPGARMVIWFQGCDIGCEGCCNPELQPLVPRHLVGLSELLEVAADSKAGTSSACRSCWRSPPTPRGPWASRA